MLDADCISANIEAEGFFHVEVRDSVTSTNSVLLEMAAKGAPEGLVLVAEEQTAGKGRLGRSFYSPGCGHGVYFSVLLHPCVNPSDVTLITPAAAVATAHAIENVFGVRVGIKWVNDLLVDGKKVCGILTETIIGAESGLVESAVLGIGVNIVRPEKGFPGELEGIAAALISDNATENEDRRSRLVAAVLDEFRRYYRNLPAREFLDEYRERSIVIGQDIYVVSGGAEKPARALSIDDDCRLIVQYKDIANAGAGNSGSDEFTTPVALNSGEVSLKGVH